MDRLPDVVETERLRLRRAILADAEALFALFNNWNVVRWLARPQWPNELGRTEAYLQNANRDALGEHYWVIQHDNTTLGGISVNIAPASAMQSGLGPHIGYWLGEPFWGNGYMSEAVEALVRQIFSVMPVPFVYSGIFMGNSASWRIQEKLGFAVEAGNTLFCAPQGKELPHLSTVLSRENFEKRSK